MAPDDCCLRVFSRRCSSPSLKRDGLCTQEDIPEMTEFDFQEEATNNTTASALCSLASFVLREASCHVMKILRQHYGGVRVARTRGLLPTVHVTLSATWGSHLEALPPAPVEPSNDHSPSQHLDWHLMTLSQNHLASCFQIPDPQKP